MLASSPQMNANKRKFINVVDVHNSGLIRGQSNNSPRYGPAM